MPVIILTEWHENCSLKKQFKFLNLVERNPMFAQCLLLAVLSIGSYFGNPQEYTIVEPDPEIVQSQVVTFPVHGPVLVQAQKHYTHFPKIILRSRKTGQILFEHEIQDEDGTIKDHQLLGFRVLRIKGIPTPVIFALGIVAGGSNSTFYLALIGEVDGKLTSLLDRQLDCGTQGGYYVGYLNKKYGVGFVRWTYIWDMDQEVHYDFHHYEIEVFSYINGKFTQVEKYISKKKYDDYGFGAVHELGIRARDQRSRVPRN